MAQYVEAFLIPLPKKNLKAYKKMATWGRRVWMKHGALSYYECVMTDFTKHGLGFQKMCKLKSTDTAIFAFIIYKSKAHRNKVYKGVTVEMEKYKLPPVMPFDMKKFAQAGCDVLIRS